MQGVYSPSDSCFVSVTTSQGNLIRSPDPRSHLSLSKHPLEDDPGFWSSSFFQLLPEMGFRD